MPNTLVAGGGGNASGVLEGLGALLMQKVSPATPTNGAHPELPGPPASSAKA
jgi:hypothetical protein